MIFKLSELPYPTDALEPHIDQRTMEIHHGKHHAAYVEKLNQALEQEPRLAERTLAELLANNCRMVPQTIRTVVSNNGGGHVNHELFWTLMSPDPSGEPVGRLARAISENFGDLDNFKQLFGEAGMNRFGSGWAWLVLDREGKLEITSTSNQDSPLMFGRSPLLGLDLWEHAYYLKYQNRRAEYIRAWWNVLDWSSVEQRFKTLESLRTESVTV
jgi:Fe-Mn family superoxide dismutase